MQYIYVFTFLLALPLVYNILYSLRFETVFKNGKVWQIKIGYIFLTLICSHLLAEMLSTFVNSFVALF